MSVSERQKAAIGRRRNEVETPALILDLDAARANIATMAEKVAALPAALRPHAKLHKSPKIAQMQVDAGAIGIATATIREAIAMANAGIDDILIANEVVGPDKVAALAEVARSTRITVAVDSPANLDQLSAAASAAASTIGVIVEVDVGMGRCGVRSKEEALEVARHARGPAGHRVARRDGLRGALHARARPRDPRAEAGQGGQRPARSGRSPGRRRHRLRDHLRRRDGNLRPDRRASPRDRVAGGLVRLHGRLPRQPHPGLPARRSPCSRRWSAGTARASCSTPGARPWAPI